MDMLHHVATEGFLQGWPDLCRLLTAEHIAAPRNDQDVAVIEDARFSDEAGSWSQSGDPVQVVLSSFSN